MQTLCDVHRSALHHVFCVYRNNRTCDVTLFHCTITYDHDVIQHLSVFLHDDGQVVVTGYFYFLSYIADIRDLKRGVRGSLNRELTVKIGNGTLLGTLHFHSRTDNRLACFIIYCSLYNVLSQCSHREQTEQEQSY